MQHSAGLQLQPANHGADDARVRIGAAVAIPGVPGSRGGDPAEVLAEAGVDPQLFDDAESRISFAAWDRLPRHCAQATGCDCFGLLAGRQNDLGNWRWRATSQC